MALAIGVACRPDLGAVSLARAAPLSPDDTLTFTAEVQSGRLGVEAALVALEATREDIRGCFTVAGATRPIPAGDLRLRVRFAPDGAPRTIDVLADYVGDTDLSGCVRVGLWRLETTGAGTVEYAIGYAPPPPQVDVLARRVAVRRAVREGGAAIQQCYLDGLVHTPTASGSATLGFRIEADGTVSAARIVSGTLGLPEVTECILGVFRAMQFAPDEVQGPLDVRFPFAFAPEEPTSPRSAAPAR